MNWPLLVALWGVQVSGVLLFTVAAVLVTGAGWGRLWERRRFLAMLVVGTAGFTFLGGYLAGVLGSVTFIVLAVILIVFGWAYSVAARRRSPPEVQRWYADFQRQHGRSNNFLTIALLAWVAVGSLLVSLVMRQ